MKSFALFLHGRYGSPELPFYKSLARARVCVAVDGGLSFFQKSGLKPDLIIGDFDSIKRDPSRSYPDAEIIMFPVAKDKTDTQLAVECAIKRGAKAVDIVQPIFGEADHFTGNLMLLASLIGDRRLRRLRVRLVNAAYEILFLRDRDCTFIDATNSTVSVAPLTNTIRLSCSGTAFPADQLLVRRGETVALRNKIVRSRARIEVKGQAFVFHQFSRKFR